MNKQGLRINQVMKVPRAWATNAGSISDDFTMLETESNFWFMGSGTIYTFLDKKHVKMNEYLAVRT